MNGENYSYKGKRYIALARASAATQGTTSTQAQLAMLHENAKARGMTLAAEIVLDGVSGSMPGKRQDMADLLRRKREDNDFDVLIIRRMDRLTRSGSGHGFWFEHECKRAGIELLVVDDDIPQGRHASLIKAARYEATQEQAFSISRRSTQGYQLALEQGRVTTSSHTPYACWRLYLSADDKPMHIIREPNAIKHKPWMAGSAVGGLHSPATFIGWRGDFAARRKAMAANVDGVAAREIDARRCRRESGQCACFHAGFPSLV